MAIPWATNLLHFHINKLFNFVNLALFCLATVLATFIKTGRFFPNHLVTLFGTDKCWILSRLKTKLKRLVVLQINSKGFIMDLNYLERIKLTQIYFKK
jgi:hypothetical protein